MTTPSACRTGDAAAALSHFRHHSIDDALRGDRESTVVQDRTQSRLRDRSLERQQRTQLCIPVLFDDEDDFVSVEEVVDFLTEREGTDAHVVHTHAACLQDIECLAYRSVGAAHCDDCDIEGAT